MLKDISQLAPPVNSSDPFYSGILLDEEEKLIRDSGLYQYFKRGLLSGVPDGAVFSNVLGVLLHRLPHDVATSSGCGGVPPYVDKSSTMTKEQVHEVYCKIRALLSRVWARRAIIQNTTENGEKKAGKKPKGPKPG